MIDPTAVVHANAQLGENVSIGAYSIIGPDVKVGGNTQVGPHVVITGITEIGRDNRIFQFCSLGDEPQHLNYKGEPTRLEIGSNNTIREYCSINRGTQEGGAVTRVGNNNLIMAYSHIAHDCLVGNETVFANCASLAGHVEVGDYAVLGGFTVAHQFCNIGAHCITALGTITFKDIPPFLVAAGNTAKPHGINVKGLRRRGFQPRVVASLRRAYKTVYKSGLQLAAALEQLKASESECLEVQEFIAFIKRSERGIIR